MNKLLTTAAMLSMTAGLAMAQGDCCDSQKAGECEVQFEWVSELPAGMYRLGVSPDAAPMALATIGMQPEAKTSTHMVMIQQDGDHEYKIEITDGQTKAWVDGERVPEKRVKVADGQVTIVDRSGKTIAEFQTAMGDPMRRGGEKRQRIVTRGLGEGDGPIVWESDDDGVWAVPGDGHDMILVQPDTEHPPVMIGINMSTLNPDEADDRVLEYLDEKGIDPENTIVVLSVIDDLPADEAGLRDGDVIVRVDGDWGVNAQKLREVLLEKEPGDSLELGVIRKGKFREYEVELAGWDAERLGANLTYDFTPGDGPGNPMMFQWRGEDGQDITKLLHERLGDLGGDNKELELQLRALVEGMNKDGHKFQFDVMPRIQRFGPGGEGMERYLVQPAPHAEAMGGFEERMNRIEDRLDRLESRLDRILEALERDRD